MSDDDKKRFVDVDERDQRLITEEKDAQNTRKATAGAVKTLKPYLQEKNSPVNFEELTKCDLDNVLAKFYAEVRQENGDQYKRASMFSIRHGINRHLSNIGKHFDIIHDPAFVESNKMFTAVTKKLKRIGKGEIEHYPPIESADLAKMYQYFDLEDNVKLQEKVFVDLMLYFGRRGRENIHNLKVYDFTAQRDSEGQMFIYMVNGEQTKNHQDDPNSAQGRMYAKPDDHMCPVKTFMKYKRHLNGKCDRLFQRPSKKENPLSRYDAAPLGHNSIGNILPSISMKAGLSRRYTNHSLRATAVHILDATGEFAGRHIMNVTGHKSENSLKTYTGYTDPKIKQKMSDTISSTVRGNQDKRRKMSVPQTSRTPSDSHVVEQPLTTSQESVLLSDLNWQEDDDFDDIFRGIETNNAMTTHQVQAPQVVFQPQQTWQNFSYVSRQQAMLFPVLNNCTNVTVNFNFNKKQSSELCVEYL